MALFTDNAMDAGLNYISSTSGRLDICTQEPATYTEATSTYTAGNKTPPTVGSPTNGDSSGRKVVISAITDGDITTTGTATHWALVATTATELLATTSLSSSQSVTTGNTFTLAAIDITIPDPS